MLEAGSSVGVLRVCLVRIYEVFPTSCRGAAAALEL